MAIQSAPEGSEHTEDFAERASGSAAVGEDFQPDILEQAAGPAPVLITEQQVLFGTAAALPSRPAKRVRPARRQYSRRAASYFEGSLISREGFRL